MSDVIDARLRAVRRSALFACALALLGALGALGASSASALGEQCSGTEANGLGAYLQFRAQTRWSTNTEVGFNGSADSLACSGSQGSGKTPKVSYTPVASPAALHAWGADDGVFHNPGRNFLGTDIAPSGPVGEEKTMLANMKSALGSDVVVIPVTQSAIAISANPPALPAHPACTVPRITATQLQKVFSGEIKNWRQLGAASDNTLGGDCDQAITRIVREESAGTTYQFKHYLNEVNPAGLPCTGKSQRSWGQLMAPFGGEVPANVEWPSNAGCQEGEGPVTVVSKGNGEGETGALLYVAEHPGTITYASLPEALDWTPKLILDVHNGAKYADAATESGAANCSAVKYTLPEGFEKGVNVDWSQVFGTNPKIGETASNAYPICTLSWDIAAADSAGLFGGKVATTVRDYLRFVTASKDGQQSVRSIGYQDLPANVQEAAAAAIAQIGGEEKEEEGEEEEGGESGTGTVLCMTKPEEAGGTLKCPSGHGWTGQIGGVLFSGTSGVFTQLGGPEEAQFKCGRGVFVGNFKEDGTPVTGLETFGFEECSNPFGEAPVNIFLNSSAAASKLVYLGPLAPQGAFYVGGAEGKQVRLRVKSPEFICDYALANLGGQIVNPGSLTSQPPYGPAEVTRWIIQALWLYQEGEGPCAEGLQQSAQLTVEQGNGESGQSLHIAGA